MTAPEKLKANEINRSLEIDPAWELDRLATDLEQVGLSPGRCAICGHVFVDEVDECVRDPESGEILCLAALEGAEDNDCPKHAANAPSDSAPRVKVVVEVLVDRDGNWSAFGNSGEALTGLERDAATYHLTADLKLPRPVEVLPAIDREKSGA